MTKRQIVPIKQWKAASLDERESLAPAVAHAAPVDIVTKAEDGAPLERTLGWTISTESRDRDGDRISIKGWDLKNYKKSPVVPWAHNYQDLPVAKAVRIEVDKEKGRLYALKKFATKEQNPFGAMVYELARDGFLNTASVGFIPKDYAPDQPQEGEDEKAFVGYFHKKQELLESSIVVVPSNPTALQSAKSIHAIDLSPYIPWAEKILDGEKGAGLWIPKKKIEELFATVSPPKPTVIVPAALEERGVAVVAGPDTTADNVIGTTSGAIWVADQTQTRGIDWVSTTDTTLTIDRSAAIASPFISTPTPGFVFGGAYKKSIREEVLSVLASLGITAVAQPILESAQAETPAQTEAPQAEPPAAQNEQPHVLSGDEPRAEEPDNTTENETQDVPPDVLLDALREVLGAPSR